MKLQALAKIPERSASALYIQYMEVSLRASTLILAFWQKSLKDGFLRRRESNNVQISVGKMCTLPIESFINWGVGHCSQGHAQRKPGPPVKCGKREHHTSKIIKLVTPNTSKKWNSVLIEIRQA